MRLICVSPQLCGDYGVVVRGEEFEAGEDTARALLAAGMARRLGPPDVLYSVEDPPPPTATERSSSEPLVTCLCLTRNRRLWLAKAIDCFRLQTYANRELLIVADGEDVRDLAIGAAAVRLFAVSRSEIGPKRNFGCERARGAIVMHWDDDDYSSPARIADQVERLITSGKAVTGYSSLRFTDGRSSWLYRGAPHYAVGTSLCYWRDWWRRHPFPALQVGEDDAFVGAAAAAGQLVSVDGGELMYATVHASNTSPRQLSGANWARL